MVKINGIDKEVAGLSITDYLAQTDYEQTYIALEYNGEIVPKASFDHTILKDGDVVEVVSFVGGG